MGSLAQVDQDYLSALFKLSDLSRQMATYVQIYTLQLGFKVQFSLSSLGESVTFMKTKPCVSSSLALTLRLWGPSTSLRMHCRNAIKKLFQAIQALGNPAQENQGKGVDTGLSQTQQVPRS